MMSYLLPRLLQLTAKRLNLKPEECIFLDDLAKNCEGAEAAGMVAIEVGCLRNDVLILAKPLHEHGIV